LKGKIIALYSDETAKGDREKKGGKGSSRKGSPDLCGEKKFTEVEGEQTPRGSKKMRTKKETRKDTNYLSQDSKKLKEIRYFVRRVYVCLYKGK